MCVFVCVNESLIYDVFIFQQAPLTLTAGQHQGGVPHGSYSSVFEEIQTVPRPDTPDAERV